MKKFFIFLCLIVFVTGCATSKQNTPKTSTLTDQSSPGVDDSGPEMTAQLKTVSTEENPSEESEPKPSAKGIVFAKTEFHGVVQTAYVKLVLEHLEDETKKFQLNIGEKGGGSPFTWDVKNVEPGYFYIELPEGKYKISSISIPVGSSTATENVDLRFNVIAGEIQYIGTLKVVGTKEKIKLGGVPVIKPGFEYIIEILNEKEEALTTFQQRYPHVEGKVNVDLMILNKKTNAESNPAKDQNQ
ncbi:MAG: hypothetical protein KC618_02445 [Candidatus Omnitrophica bacterium]|nr:hypothetical protein [Candidatus Omnitrophota bacterium]